MEKVIKKIVSCRMLYYVIAIVLFIGTYYLNLKVDLESQNALGGNHLKYFLIASALIAIVIIALTIISKKLYKKVSMHVAYIILALILGGIYIFVVPLFAQSDEPAHFYRTYQVAKGEIISPVTEMGYTTEIPQSFVDMVQLNSETKRREYKKYYDVKEMMQIELEPEKTTIINTVGTYHGTSYFPQALGIKIGMIFNLRPYLTAMLGRLTGLVITVLLLGWGIKKLPNHKLFATIVLLSPVAISYAASFSADNIVLVSTFLMLSYVMYYRHSKEKIKKIDYVIFAILTFIIAISKMAYLPVIGLLLLIPKECFNNTKRKWAFSAIFIILGIISAIWWMKSANISVDVGEATDTNTWIYTNPIGYLFVLVRTTIDSCFDYATNMFAGHFLCHNQVSPYTIIPLAYIIITIIALLADENKEKTTFLQKFIPAGIIVLSYVLVSTAMYVYNTSFKNGVIIGVQGRYFVPLLLLAILFINKKRINIEEHELTNVALVANFGVYLAMMTTFFI